MPVSKKKSDDIQPTNKVETTPKVEEKQETKTVGVKEEIKLEQKTENKKIEKSERENMIGELKRKTTKRQ